MISLEMVGFGISDEFCRLSANTLSELSLLQAQEKLVLLGGESLTSVGFCFLISEMKWLSSIKQTGFNSSGTVAA